MKTKLDNIVYFILGGFVILGILGIFASPAISDIPPTRAFSSINGTDGNITATTYHQNLELVEGSGIDFDFNNIAKELTIATTGGSSPNELYCAAGKWFNAFNSTTNNFNCETVPAGSVYENNTMSSPTHANSLVLAKSGVNLPIKGIACGGSIICSSNITDVTLTYTATGGGNMTVLNDGGDVTITSPSPLSVLYYVGSQWIDKIFSINSFDVNCSDTQQLNRLQVDNQTGIVTGTCETDETGSGGTPRGGYLMAHWTMSQTKTNIGTSFIDVYSQTNSNGKAIFIDTDTFTTVRLHIQWNKVGTGTQTCQVITGATVLVSMNVVSGSNDSGFVAIPGGLLNAENAFRIQCKSTTSTDDPIFESASIWLK